MQRMGGIGPGGQGPPQMQQQQRMAMGGHPDQQIQRRLAHELSSEPRQPGWQMGVKIQTRVVHIWQLLSYFKLAHNDRLTLEKAIGMAKGMERKDFSESSSEEQYVAVMRERISQMSKSRQSGQPGPGQLPNQDPRVAYQQMQMPNGMANGMAMPMQSQLPPGYQNPMQSSSFQQAMNAQQSQPGLMANAMATAQMAQNQRLQQNMPQQLSQRLSPEEEHMITQMALQMQQRAAPELLEQVNQKVAGFPVELRQKLNQQGVTPQQYWFRMNAVRSWQTQKAQRVRAAASNQHQQLGRQDGNFVNQMNQQARQTPRNPNLEQPIPNAGQNATGFEPGGNVKNNMQEIEALQQEAMRSQERGHQVVPASSSQPMVPPTQQQRTNIQNTPRQQPSMQQNPQHSSTPNVQHQQMMARHQQKEKIHAARMAQMPQQPALTGQLGGLSTNIGQNVSRQSPAMPTLNKPLERPTQQGQATPNQRPQQPPTSDQPAPSQPSAHAPQEQTGGAPQFNPAQLNAMISRFPQGLQQRLSTMPPAERLKVAYMLLRKSQNAKNAAGMTGPPPGMAPNSFPNGQNISSGHDQQNRTMPSGQQSTGVQQVYNAPVPQMRGTNQPNLQSGQQQWGSQGTPNSQNVQGMIAAHQLSNEGKNQQGQTFALTPDKVRAMDNQLYPLNIIKDTVVGMPPEVRTWGQLKSWVMQRPEFSREVMEKLKNLQAMQYQSFTMRQPQPQINSQATPTTASMLPQAPVPTAQMVPTVSQPPMQNGPNAIFRPGQPFILKKPTQEEVQSYRLKLPADFSHLTDHQIAQQLWITREKATQARLAQHAQHAQQSANARQTPMQVMQQMNNLQRGLSSTPGNQSSQNQQLPSGIQATAKPPTGVKPSPNIANATPTQQTRINQHTIQQTMAKGVKRGSTDDVVEVPNPNFLQQQGHQRLGKQGQGNQQNGVQQQGHDRAQYEAELRQYAAPGAPAAAAKPSGLGPRSGQTNSAASAQMAQQPEQQAPMQYQPLGNEEMAQRRTRLSQLQQEVYRNLPQRPLIPLDADASRNMAALLQREFLLLTKTENAIGFYFMRWRAPEPTIRELLTIRLLILGQYRDRLGNTNDYFTIHPNELQAGLNRLRQFMQFFMKMAAQGHPQGQAVPVPHPQQTKPVLTEQNLQQNQQAEQQAHQKARQNQIEKQHSNRGMRVPAAPTTTQPPFSFGPQSPPHGIPQYGNQGLTADQLHIPAKRRKPNGPSAASTPAEKKATPGSSASPKVTKDAVPASVKPIPVTHKCFVANCPVSKPFPTAEALAKHKRDAHEAKEPAIENPFDWAMESIRIGLGLDENGELKPKERKLEGGVEMKKSGSAHGVMPLKQEGGTPGTNSLKTPQPSQAQGKSPVPPKGSAPPLSKPGQALQNAPQLPPTPPHSLWDDTPFSPHLLSSYFPSLADLHSSLATNLTTLTPASTTSRSADASPRTDKDSPEGRKSDISDSNNLDMTIRIGDADGANAKNKFWPDGFFNDCMYPEHAPVIDEETLGMGWEELFGESPVKEPGGKKRKENEGFDASLFRIHQ